MPAEHYDGWVNFETMTTELDGEVFPVTKLIDVNGKLTDDPDKAVIYHAGRDYKWFSARVHRNQG